MEANTSVNQLTSRETGARQKEQMSGNARTWSYHAYHAYVDITSKE